MIWVYASELNRAQFKTWNSVQLVLAILALGVAVLRFRSRAVIACIALALLLVAVMMFHFSPRIVELGRELDFVTRTPEPPGLAEFNALHKTYTAIAVAKLALVLIATGFTLRGRSVSTAP